MPLAALFASHYWQLVPLIVIVSLVYSGTRYDQWDHILKDACRWGLRLCGFLGGIGLALFVASWWC